MDLAIGFGIFVAALLASVAAGIPVVFAVLAGAACFTAIGLHRGFSIKAMLGMIAHGMERCVPVLRIFVLIGLLTALWRASGTIPLLVYYSMKSIPSHLFILFAFLLTALVSYMLGTAFGTVGTIGIVLMVIAMGGDVPVSLTAGAIVSGAYYGDRCAPTSSCANLVAAITHTPLYGNVRLMLKNSLVPLLISAGAYLCLSPLNPLRTYDSAIEEEIAFSFGLNGLVLLPALLILVLPMFKVRVAWAMTASIAAAVLSAGTLQDMGWSEILHTALYGYSMAGEGRFASIIGGGGVLSMANVALLVLISSSFSGIFAGTGMLEGVEHWLEGFSRRAGLFPATLLTGAASSVVACNQTLAVMVTQQLMRPIYARRNRSDQELAMGLANSAVLLPALVPWNVACALALSTLGAGPEALPWCFFILITPLWHLARACRDKERSPHGNGPEQG